MYQHRERPSQQAIADRTIRASNQEREAVVSTLSEHTSAGRLTLTEFEERAAAAYAARTLGDLDALLTDLPVVRATEPPRRRSGPRVVWSPWLFVGMICVGIWLMSSLSGGWHFFWPFWVIGPWGFMLFCRALAGPHRRR